MLKYSLDLQIVDALVLLTISSILLPQLNETPLRIFFALPFIIFLLGYSIISALFPRSDDLNPIERIAMSFGLSISIVPLLGLILNYTPFGIRLVPIIITISLSIISITILAYNRRMNVDEDERFTIPFKFRITLRNLFLLIFVVMFVCALIHAVTNLKKGEKFTEFYILNSNGSADNYPKNIIVGENESVIVGVVNHEYESMKYKLKIKLCNEILEEKEIILMDNETFRENFTFIPMKECNGKLEFLLYKENITKPYRLLHLWIEAM